jgi:hypothetical protein
VIQYSAENWGAKMVQVGEQLWAPTPERTERARMTQYLRWLKTERGLQFADYEALWRWSTTDLDAFWQSCWDFFGIEASTPATAVLGKRTMPGAEWFPGATLNYARAVLSSGLADLKAASAWELGFVQDAAHRAQYNDILQRLCTR